MDSNPLVSICIPAFNREKLVENALMSATHQTYPNIEVVVVDNASTDGTPKILEKWSHRDPRIKYFRNKTNIGSGRNFLECARHASGYFAQALGSDDWLSRNYIGECVRQFRTYPDAASIVTDDIAFKTNADGSLELLDMQKISEGIYSSDWYFKHVGREPRWFSGFISMMRRDDMVRALTEEMENQEHWLQRGLLKEPIDEIVYFRVLARYPYLVLTKKAAYLKVVHETNVGLSGEISRSHNQLPYFLAVEVAREAFYRVHKPRYLKQLRIFACLEIAKRVVLQGILGIIKAVGINRGKRINGYVENVKVFFDNYSGREKFLTSILLVPFLISRLLQKIQRSHKPKRTFTPTNDYFLNKDYHFMVE